MPTIKTIKPAGGGDYTTLQGWWDGFAKSQTSPAQWAEVYGGGDAGPLSISSFTGGAVADASNHVKIYAASGEQHSGVFNSAKAKIASGGVAIDLSSANAATLNFMQIVGLQFQIASGSYGLILQSSAVGIEFEFLQCLMTLDGSGSTNAINIIGTSGSNYTVEDSIVYCTGTASGDNNGPVIFYGNAAATWNVFNNTILNADGSPGMRFTTHSVGEAFNVYNNFIAMVTGDAFSSGGSGSFIRTWKNNASTDATAGAFGGTGNLTNLTASACVVNAATNANLLPSSALRDAGFDLTGVNIYDATGTAWVAPYSINALQYVLAATTTTISSNHNPANFGQPITFTSSVTGSGGTPTGTVTFKDGTTSIGTGNLSGGTTTFSTSALATGTHSITANYGGDTNYATSISSPLSQVVGDMPSSNTTVTTSQNPIAPSASLVVTATVTGSTPTGVVTFYNGAASIGTGTITTGVTTLTLNPVSSKLSLGTNSIVAVYAGDLGNSSSTSVPVIQSLNFGGKGTSAQLTENLRVDVLPNGGIKFVTNGSEVAP